MNGAEDLDGFNALHLEMHLRASESCKYMLGYIKVSFANDFPFLVVVLVWHYQAKVPVCILLAIWSNDRCAVSLVVPELFLGFPIL